MMKLAGKPAVQHVIERVSAAKKIDDVCVACSDAPGDDQLAEFVANLGVKVVRGDENDVLTRFVQAAQAMEADVIVRITADCPMADPGVIDAVVERYKKGDVDFVSNTLQRSYPDGLDVEVFGRSVLEKTDREATDSFLRSHVTPYIHGRLKDRFPCGDFSKAQVVHDGDFSKLRWTLDEPDDFTFLERVLPKLPEGFGWMDVLSLLTQEPALLKINNGHGLYEGVKRDLGDLKNMRSFDQSNRFFERAAKSIPLASQTFSKSYQQWAKGAAPLFIDRARGARVWDLDGNEYIDYVLGLLPIVLSHRDPDVDEAIINQMDKGILFSLASPLEAELAERLIRLIPCAEKVRFGKNGSDVTTAAVRLARAHTGREKVAVCGYHGWHDWYIGTTTRNAGVPSGVKSLTTDLPFNDADALEDFLNMNGDDVACVMLEPTSKSPAAPGYLERVREVTEKHGVVLVFDEIVTGFRVSLGGAQEKSGVTPDLATFGKSMANGMPISAIVGKDQIMSGMEEIFFSTTFGGETLSLAAAIATLDKLEKENVPQRLATLGEGLKDSLNALIANAGLADVLLWEGENWWPRLSVMNAPINETMLITLLRQELAANGLLLGAGLNLCLAHENAEVKKQTAERYGLALAALAEALKREDPASALRGALVEPTFAVRK